MQKPSADSLIVEALRKGNKTWGELEKACMDNGYSRSTFSRTLQRLLAKDRTVVPVLEWSPGQTPAIEYTLVPEGYRGNEKDRAIAAIARFYDIMCRYPDIEELALLMAVTPKDAESVAYETRRETGWTPPTDKKKEGSKREVGENLVLAAKIKADPEKNWVEPFQYNEEDVESARRYLEIYPELVPTLTDSGDLEWPKESEPYFPDGYIPGRRGRVITRSF